MQRTIAAGILATLALPFPARAQDRAEPPSLDGVRAFLLADALAIQSDRQGRRIAQNDACRALFDREGVLILPPDADPAMATWSLRWKWGIPVRLTSAGAEVHVTSASRTERWENRPKGLKQTIVLPRPPARILIPIRTQLSLRGAPAGSRIVFSDRGHDVLEVRDLRAADAAGRALPGRLVVADGGIRIEIDDRGATYPVTIDPLLTTPGWASSGDDQAQATFGYSVAPAGDVNGDGFDDVVATARQFNTGQVDAGKAYVFLGSATGVTATPAWTSSGNDQAGAGFGFCAAPAGDVNGDGYDDVIVGANVFDGAGVDCGKAYLYLGSAAGLSVTPAWASTGDGVTYAYFGWSLAGAGDVNGDGFDDVIIGAHGITVGGALWAGKVYVYHGSPGNLPAAPSWTELGEAEPLGSFGFSVASAGDVNGDGYDDVVIGAANIDATDGSGNVIAAYAGKAYVYLGSPAGLGSAPAWTSWGEQEAIAMFGYCVAGLGDANGDGFDDIAVGAPLADVSYPNAGKTFVFHGSAGGPSSTPNWESAGDDAPGPGPGGGGGAWFGHSLAGAGDVNNDGYADLIVGARYQNTAVEGAGKAFVYHGSPTGLATAPEWTSSGDDQLGAEYGFCVAGAGDINGDSISDAIVGAFRFDTAGQDAGKAYVYAGSAGGLPSGADWESTGGNQANSHFGWSLSTAGDVNGDGYDDVIVGAPMYNPGQIQAGKAYLFLGSVSGLSVVPTWQVAGDAAGARLGACVAAAGDVNGDGYDDVIVSAPWFNSPDQVAGRAFVYFGTPGGLTLDPAWDSLGNNAAFAFFGFSAASAGDVNGDGFDDIVVGAHGFNTSSSSAGKAYLFLGSAGGPATAPAWTSVGDNQAFAHFGRGVSGAGDVNGDGFDDVLVGADGFNSGAGKAYAYLGGSTGLATVPAWTHGGAGQAWAAFGESVGGAGDVNGDGFDDVIVGELGFSGSSGPAGKVYVFHGSTAGLSSAVSWSSVGDSQGAAWFGDSVASAGDFNGDTYDDVIVGASGFDAAGSDTGKAYIFLGGAAGLAPSAAWTSAGDDQAGAEFGYVVGRAGDVNGDAFSDVIVGAYAFDTPLALAGKVYAFHGSGATEPPPTAGIALAAGFNLISLPLEPTAPTTASGLAAQINAQNTPGMVEAVQGWNPATQAWQTYTVGLPFGDFDVGVGKGYFVRCSAAGTWTPSGTAISTLGLSLPAGFTLAGIPVGSYTASSMASALNAQNPPGIVTQVQRWNAATQAWETYGVGLPFGDFPIEPGRGYFLKASSAGSATLP